jgi:hypothetical protein
MVNIWNWRKTIYKVKQIKLAKLNITDMKELENFMSGEKDGGGSWYI